MVSLGKQYLFLIHLFIHFYFFLYFGRVHSTIIRSFIHANAQPASTSLVNNNKLQHLTITSYQPFLSAITISLTLGSALVEIF